MNKEKMFEFFFGCHPSHFAGRVIVNPFIPLKMFRNISKVDKYFKGNLYSGLTGQCNGKDITVVNSGIGPALVGDAVLLLGCTEAQEMVFVGTCGGLKDLRIGDIMIPEAAYNGEGFSFYHSKPLDLNALICRDNCVLPEENYLSGLRGFLKTDNGTSLKVSRGKVLTIGSIMAEEKETLLALAERGVEAIEMELSAVFSAADKAGIKAAAMLAVSDLPLKKGIEEGLTPEEKKDFDLSLRGIVDLSVEFMARE